MRSVFEITKQELVNIYHLIYQRIDQQNHGTLIQFTTRIVFDDGTSVLLNSLDDLLNYHEVRPVISTQVHLSWVFLIQFQDRNVPEKQTIDVSFIAGKKGTASYDRDEFVTAFLQNLPIGNTAFRIQHTARTWGADIQGLLEDHLNSILLKESVLRTLLRRHSGKLSMFVALLIMAITLVMVFATAGDLISKQKIAAAAYAGNNIPVAKKVDYIMEILATSVWNQFLLSSAMYIFIAIIFSIFVGSTIESSLQGGKPSFVLLTSASEKEKVVRLKIYKRKWFNFLMSVIVGITTGIIGNILYARYWV